MSKTGYSAEEKYDILLAYEKRVSSTIDFCLKHQITKTTLRRWKLSFEKFGIEGLKNSNGWKGYSNDRIPLVFDVCKNRLFYANGSTSNLHQKELPYSQ